MAFDVWSVVHPAALDVIHAHVMSSRDAEVGGFLVGTPGDERTPPRCTAAIEARAAVGDLTRLTFTHDAWEHVHRELEEKHPDCSIIGWYHSHPGHGIFLSEHDQFIHRNFFSAPWQIAVVVDPLHATEGLFLWTSGEITLASQRDVGATATTHVPESAGHGTPFTGRGTIAADTKRERLVVLPDASPATAIANTQPLPVAPRPFHTPPTMIAAQPAAVPTAAPQAAPDTPRDAIVLLRESDRQPEAPWDHVLPEPGDQRPEARPPPERGSTSRPRYPAAGHLLPVVAGVLAGLALSFALF